MTIPSLNIGTSTDVLNLTPEELAALTGQVVVDPTSPLGVKSTAEHSLNALVELVYVRVGNEIMGQALNNLDSALSGTQKALNALSYLQGLNNMIDIKSKSALPFNFTVTSQTIATTGTIATHDSLQLAFTTTGTIETTLFGSDAYQSGYYFLASAYYRPIDPYFSITSGAASGISITVKTQGEFDALSAHDKQREAYNSFAHQMTSAKALLDLIIPSLSAITSAGDPTTLYAKLKIVREHLPSSFASTRLWILDGYDRTEVSDVAKQGFYQQGITNAIVAGESLNSSQNAAVRRYMFIFEQYYQSASSMISQLNQLMSTIGKKIYGG